MVVATPPTTLAEVAKASGLAYRSRALTVVALLLLAPAEPPPETAA